MISTETLNALLESEGAYMRAPLAKTIVRELLAARARIAACEAECARLITDNKQDMASDRELVQLRARVAELEVPWWRRLWKRKAKRPSMAAVTRALEPQRRPGESDEELRKRIQG